jgi:hypothetical protein
LRLGQSYIGTYVPQDTPTPGSGYPGLLLASGVKVLFCGVRVSHLVLAYHRPHASAAFASRPISISVHFSISVLVCTANNDISVHCISEPHSGLPFFPPLSFHTAGIPWTSQGGDLDTFAWAAFLSFSHSICMQIYVRLKHLRLTNLALLRGLNGSSLRTPLYSM